MVTKVTKKDVYQMSNIMWHVALEPGTMKMQDVILADVDINDFQTISNLLSTNRPKGKVFETEWGGFLMMYAGEYERPFPGVMIWRFEDKNGESLIKDLRQEDAWIVERVWRDMLMPEDSDAKYDPPKKFILMSKV